MFYNLHVMYNDKSFWKDPAQFRPDRFLTEDGEVDKMRSERVLNTVFGVGNDGNQMDFVLVCFLIQFSFLIQDQEYVLVKH